MLIQFLRVFILYALVLLVIRLMGKRQVSQLQPFELVVTIMIADLAAQPLGDVNTPLLSGVIPIIVLLMMQVLISYFTMKSKKIRRFFCGEPAVIIEHGQINQRNIKEMMISVDDIMELLRSNNAPDITDVDYALIETDGAIGITKKSDKGIIVSLIENGRIFTDVIQNNNLRLDEVMERMRHSGIKDVKDVFWAFHFDKKIYFIRKTAEK